MVRRPGLGATLVASVAFSVILLASFAVYLSAQGRETLYSTAFGADALGDGFHTLAPVEGFNILLGVQEFVASHPLTCSNAASAVGQAVGEQADSQSDGNLTVMASAQLVQGSGAGDNMSALRPFDGSVAGDLNMALTFHGSGSDHGVTFSRSEVHQAHIGLRLGSAVSYCMNAVSAVEVALNALRWTNCTESAIGPVVQAAAAGPASAARAGGFQFQVSYSVAAGNACTVRFQVSLAQPDVPGPGGPFTVRFAESEQFPVETSAP